MSHLPSLMPHVMPLMSRWWYGEQAEGAQGQVDTLAQDGQLAAVHASLVHAENQLARERDEWQQRQHVHHAEAHALRQHLDRVTIQHHLVAEASLLHLASPSAANAQPWADNSDAALVAVLEVHDRTQEMMATVEARHHLHRMRKELDELQDELAVMTCDKFELHHRLVECEGEMASRAAFEASCLAQEVPAQYSMRHELLRARHAKGSADQSLAHAQGQASALARQARGDMLMMAKLMIGMHQVGLAS